MSQSYPFNVIKASSISSVVLDCVVNPFLTNVGKTVLGGAATDNTAAINKALLSLAAVGVGSVKLILDGGTLVSGLTLPTLGNYDIEGTGWTSGIFIASGSNADPLNNGKILPFDPNTTPPASGQYVRLANFCINGNRGNGTTGNSNSGDPRGVNGVYWYCNINLANLLGVRIEDMLVYDAGAYSIRTNNCSDVIVKGCRIINPCVTFTLNQDCVHNDGPASKITIKDNYMSNNNSDDAISIASSEGYGGLIDNVVVEGNTFQTVANAIRIGGAAEGQIGTVLFSDNSGQTGSVGIFGFAGATGEYIRTVIFSQNSFTCGIYLSLNGGIGDVTLSDCVWNGPFAANFFLASLFGGSVSTITVNNCRVLRTTAGNNTNTPLLGVTTSPLAVGRLTINGYDVCNENGQSYGAIPEVLAMTNITISELFIGRLDFTNITALADVYTNIGAIKGTVAFGNETVAFSATPTFSQYTRSSTMTLTGNVTTFTLPAGIDGQEKTLIFIQNSGGSHTVAAPSNVRGFMGVGLTANKVSAQHFTYNVALTAWLADSPGVINA